MQAVEKMGLYCQSKCLIVMVCVSLVCVLVCKMLGDLSKATEVQGGIFALADLYFVFFISIHIVSLPTFTSFGFVRFQQNELSVFGVVLLLLSPPVGLI